MVDTDVLIVGAGPVGLTLAVDLGMRGVRCTLVEQKEAPQFLPKMERCNARTMEIFRRMGLADRIRAAGLPAECPMDVFIVTSILEPPLLHLPYPSVAAAKREIAASTDASMPLEPYQLISQYTLEPLLKAVAETLPSVTVRYGTEFLEFAEHPDRVTAQAPRRRRRDRNHRALSRRLRRRRERGPQAARHRAHRRGQSARAAPGRSTAATGSTSASRSARAGTITWRTPGTPS